jgi:uncharacterized protein (TIGR03089 family)
MSDSRPLLPRNGARNFGVLLAQRVQERGHSPCLTYYGASAERTELSYATFANWVAKTANLLVEELGLERRGRVALGVTDHWIGAVVAVAAWKVGAVLVPVENMEATDVVVVAESAVDGQVAGHRGLVVVGAGLGGRVAGDTPGLRYGNEVAAFGDDFDDPAVSVEDPAMDWHGVALTQAEVLANAPDVTGDDRLLVTGVLGPGLAIVSAPVGAGAGVVWCPGAEDTWAVARAAEERCTHRLDAAGGVVAL